MKKVPSTILSVLFFLLAKLSFFVLAKNHIYKILFSSIARHAVKVFVGILKILVLNNSYLLCNQIVQPFVYILKKIKRYGF